MNQNVTVVEVFNAISRLPEEEKVCVLQLIGLPGLANTLNSKEEYEKAVEKMAFYIDTYKVAIRAIKNIHDDVEKQLMMKQRGEI